MIEFVPIGSGRVNIRVLQVAPSLSQAMAQGAQLRPVYFNWGCRRRLRDGDVWLGLSQAGSLL